MGSSEMRKMCTTLRCELLARTKRTTLFNIYTPQQRRHNRDGWTLQSKTNQHTKQKEEPSHHNDPICSLCFFGEGRALARTLDTRSVALRQRFNGLTGDSSDRAATRSVRYCNNKYSESGFWIAPFCLRESHRCCCLVSHVQRVQYVLRVHRHNTRLARESSAQTLEFQYSLR